MISYAGKADRPTIFITVSVRTQNVKPQMANPTAAASVCLGFGPLWSSGWFSENSKLALVLSLAQPDGDQSKTIKSEPPKVSRLSPLSCFTFAPGRIP